MVSHLPALMQRVAAIRAQLGDLAPPTQQTSQQLFSHVLAGARSQVAAPGRVDEIVAQAAARYDVDPDLIHAVIQAESDYDPLCLSRAGAIGLMQLMPGTADGLDVSDPWDPAQNVDGGTRYLRQQLDSFGDLRLALAAYNAGPGAVRRYGGVPPYSETQTYVERVLTYLQDSRNAQMPTAR